MTYPFPPRSILCQNLFTMLHVVLTVIRCRLFSSTSHIVRSVFSLLVWHYILPIIALRCLAGMDATLLPAARSSDNPIAMACFRFLTRGPFLRPELRVPAENSFIVAAIPGMASSPGAL